MRAVSRTITLTLPRPSQSGLSTDHARAISRIMHYLRTPGFHLVVLAFPTGYGKTSMFMPPALEAAGDGLVFLMYPTKALENDQKWRLAKGVAEGVAESYGSITGDGYLTFLPGWLVANVILSNADKYAAKLGITGEYEPEKLVEAVMATFDTDFPDAHEYGITSVTTRRPELRLLISSSVARIGAGGGI